MDFSLTSQQSRFREMVREFCKKELAPYSAKWNEKGEIPEEIFKKMFDLGFVGIFVPREFGGSGMQQINRMIMMEEISKICMSLSYFIEGNQSGMARLLYLGSEEQKRYYLNRICKGELRSCTAMTESSSGSDMSSWQTTAAVSGDGYILNGRKTFICNGEFADIVFTIAKIKDGFSLFIVPKEKVRPVFLLGEERGTQG